MSQFYLLKGILSSLGRRQGLGTVFLFKTTFKKYQTVNFVNATGFNKNTAKIKKLLEARHSLTLSGSQEITYMTIILLSTLPLYPPRK